MSSTQHNEPWNLKVDDERTVDSVTTFIIFCEDEVSEPKYLESFDDGDPNLKIITIKGKKSNLSNVVAAISYCIEKNFFIDGKVPEEMASRVWCVYDRDIPDNPKTETDVVFDESIPMAERHNINVAWSNDCFELWILLHITDITPEMVSRNDYYSFLDNYFRSIEQPCELLVKALQHQTFSYKKDLKKERLFNQIVLPILKDVRLRTVAIQRAQNLLSVYSTSSLPHEMLPCTKMHLLVQEILKYSRL